MKSIGRRDRASLFKLGDELIQFGGLHTLLAGSVADMLPVVVSVLLSDDAKRLARSNMQSRNASGAAANGTVTANGAAAQSFEGLMTSPWKVGRFAAGI